MILVCVDKDEYKSIVKSSLYSYNEPWFHELNKYKVSNIRYMIFKSKRIKFGIVAGVDDNVMKFPYSAPYSIFEKVSIDIRIEDIEEALEALEDYCREESITKIVFRLPPTFYDESFISKVQSCLLRKQFIIDSYDLNYQYMLRSSQCYENHLKRNAKKNLIIAETYNYALIYCDDDLMKRKAYDIIAINRKNKGYPLRMKWGQVHDTIEKMDHDFFLLKLDDTYVASAIIFKVTEEVYQVIYWGDIGGYTEQKPMNYLACQLYNYYLEKKVTVLDIGPSTEDGIPNYGLCSFKESIGCDISSKITFIKEI